jgi:hypothetical protein
VRAVNDKNDSDSAQDRERDKPPLPSQILPKNEAVLPNAEQPPPNNRAQTTTTLPARTRPIELLQLGVNGLLFVIGVAAICIYGGQLKVMKGQLDQMMQEGYGGSKAIRIQDPLFREHVRLKNELHDPNNFKAVVELENVGATPSIDLVESTQIWVAHSDESASVTWNPCPKVGVLMKSEPVSCETAPISATSDEVQAYQRGTSSLYVRVYASYWDDIEGDIRHQQSMCLSHRFGEPLDRFSYCASGNDIWHDNCETRTKENPPRPPDAPSQGPQKPGVCSGKKTN